MPEANFDLTSYLISQKQLIELYLEQNLPSLDNHPQNLFKAINYSVLNGGKRLRAILCLESYLASGGKDIKSILPISSALELIHAYSLIHDDLPAMDDDDFRRGKPTCHKVFGEATAILAGDALQPLAFQWISQSVLLSEQQRILIIQELAEAIGPFKLVGGQQADMELEQNSSASIDDVLSVHQRKTAALIAAACTCGGIAAKCNAKCLEQWRNFGETIGLAFQISDDVLNYTSTRDKLGKAVGTDKQRGKATYTTILGVTQAKQKAEELIDSALALLVQNHLTTKPLVALTKFIVERES
jgi:geranylgeranyl diphosphate synthase, type II